MKKLRTIGMWGIMTVVMLTFFVAPLDTSAAGLVACEGPSSDRPCNYDSLVLTINKIIDFLLMISASIAAIMFAVAGFKYMTAQGEPGKLSEAKGIFKKVVIGLIIIFSAWLIVKYIFEIFEVDTDFDRIFK